MHRLFFHALALALLPCVSGTTIVYNESFGEFVSKRDIVFRGVVLKIEEIEREQRTSQTQAREAELPDQLATIEIREVLKNRDQKTEIKAGETIQLVVPSTAGEIRLSGLQYHDPGYEGFWILDSSVPNYGMNTERALQTLNFEDRIREALE
ncbi:hypothetical protein [Actomonas aquatica]|uniref:DUF4384 domain-containing protein n=1 Tax=Actomonas aquatica TaxID=2866162 RepID=A0ABZ1C2V8_9BACT|nr:hypothetical protein [Opitutus sp. WL0086]WRQ85523.1 hypothetical protein K1X11_011990 [Opitutus sp. WL0086]